MYAQRSGFLIRLIFLVPSQSAKIARFYIDVKLRQDARTKDCTMSANKYKSSSTLDTSTTLCRGWHILVFWHYEFSTSVVRENSGSTWRRTLFGRARHKVGHHS